MQFHVNFKTGVPVYLQVVEQVKAAVAAGTLREGDALPAIRGLAEDLRVNRNTIARAYGELEHQRVIETQAGRGCFVRAADTPVRKDVRLRMLAADLDAVAVQAHHLRIGRADFLALAAERYDTLEERRAAAAGE